LSKAETVSNHSLLTFDAWLVHEFKITGGFTALIVLVAIDETKITPLRSTFLHVIGDEIDWSGIVRLLAGAGTEWDGVLFEPVSAADGGPVEDAAARVHLRALEVKIGDDRMALNEGHFFDKWGRRMKVEEVEP
jgi:hypothetical protein